MQVDGVVQVDAGVDEDHSQHGQAAEQVQPGDARAALWRCGAHLEPSSSSDRSTRLDEGVARSLEAEHAYKHTSIIHSHDVEAMTAMGRALDTTLFIKNSPCMAGLGLGGEGYLSYSIATPTGEGVTNPKTFTRVRRCVMVDNLRIY